MNMVEKVARAMEPTQSKIVDMLISKGCDHAKALSILPLDKARAAIEAMREPTGEMVDVGQWQIDPVSLYQSFIDAALSE